MLRFIPGLFFVLILISNCSTLNKTQNITEQHQTAYLGILYTTSDRGGVVIMDVFQGSPAEKASLNVGNIILAVDGKSVAGIYTMKEQIHAMKPGAVITLDVLKDYNSEKISKIKVKLENMPQTLQPGRYYNP